jgi:all-trans-retinol 13,14-reductase
VIPEGVTPRVRAAALLARDWDVIVVGAGIGGLVCAALLAKLERKRVLVLERHHAIGGLTQAFHRRRYAWEVGVHYVGEVLGARLLRRTLDLACDGTLAWAPLPAAHDRFVAPGIDVRIGGDRDAIRTQWLSVARGEERAADRILDAVHECARVAPSHFLARMRAGSFVPSERSPLLAFSDRTTRDVIASTGASPVLAALATYAWTDFGSPPETSSFASHAITFAHYLGGAAHPVGGGAALSAAMARTIARVGGAVVVRAEVLRADVRDGSVRGVVLADGTEIAAPIVVSDVGARATHEWLAAHDDEARDRMRRIGPSSAHVALYLGLARTPQALGLDGANVFWTRDAPGREVRDAAAWCAGDVDLPSEVYASTACAIDPSFAPRHPGRSAITLASPVSLASFERWIATHHAHRGDAYARTKQRLADGMLRAMRAPLPLDAIDHVELSTPLSTRHFTGHASGEIYGLAPTPARFRLGPGPHTRTRGLFLTGQDVWTWGVAGSASGALLAACAITSRDLAAELALRAST